MTIGKLYVVVFLVANVSVICLMWLIIYFSKVNFSDNSMKGILKEVMGRGNIFDTFISKSQNILSAFEY